MPVLRISIKTFTPMVVWLYLSLLSIPVHAGMEAFHAGPVIKDYGKVAAVDTTMSIPNDMMFKIAFDMSEQAKPGALNRHLVKLARFINMHVEAGVSLDKIHLAAVIHGKGVNDVAQQDFYHKSQPNIESANIKLVQALVAKGVRFYVCGQSAVYYNLTNKDLVKGVDMALSAMTAHGILAKQGYSLNPF